MNKPTAKKSANRDKYTTSRKLATERQMPGRVRSNFLLPILALVFTSSLIPHSLAESAHQQSITQCENDRCKVDKLILNTGYDHAAGATYNPVQPDGYWELVASPNANLTTPTPAWVIGKHPAWNTLPGSQWISAYNSPAWNTNNDKPLPPYSFQRCFCTCDNIKSVIIDFTILVDDIAEIYFDNGATPIDSVFPQSSSNFQSGKHVKATIPVKPGTHCLRIDVRNTGGVAMGLDIAGSITSDPPGLPLLLSASCCSPFGKIIGRKIHDKDCDGKDDNININQNIEPGLQGWTITLTNTATGVTSTALTDANGFYYFNNLSPGTYTVSEQVQSNWSQTIPGSSGTYTVTLAAGQVIQKDFGNCNGKKPCVEITIKEAKCKPGSPGNFIYSFDVTNNSGSAVSTILLTPPNGSSFTLTPQQFNFTNNPTTPITVEISGALPQEQICFTVALLDKELRACGCSGEVCITPPTCDCMQFVESKILWESTGFVWHFTIVNQSQFNFNHMYVLGPVTPAGAIITPSYFSPGIPSGGSYTGTATITGVAAGSTVCFNIGFYDHGLLNCCILRKHCVKIPKENPN